MTTTNHKAIQINDLTSGVYFVSVKQSNYDVNIQKLIVR
ncbi:MAG: T9SS type A sorting domain-containing protein [Bacteroidota bacterium]|nr:T9SS type A sorting domain-containing protein [Bacteroidota bacterium]